MIETADSDSIYIKHKAITAFFPYAARQGQSGQNKLLNTLLDTARASKRQDFMWHRIRLSVTTLLNEGSPVSPKCAVILMLPHLPWRNSMIDGQFIQLWATAASAVPYTHDIGQSVIDTLLLIASQDSLRPHIPTHMWAWLNKHPSLPPTCIGGCRGTEQNVVQTVRALGDIEILTSYLLHVWSEWGSICPYGLEEMCTSIKEDFCGVGVRHHWRHLLQHLDRVLGQLDPGSEPLGLGEENVQTMKSQYGQLKEVLLEVDEEVTNMLTRESQIDYYLQSTNSGCRVSHNVYVWNTSLMSIVTCL